MADVDQLLRAVFEVCEATEDIEPKNDFERGRVFEAKHIRRGVGTWFQDTFCGRTHMGEPVIPTGVRGTTAVVYERRQRDLMKPDGWGEWSRCSEKEAGEIAGMGHWQFRMMREVTHGVAPTRRPLTDDRIDELWEALEHKAPVYFCRAVEREHGITNGVPEAQPQQEKNMELPDAIRVPLDELEADAAYIIGRVAADGSCSGIMVEAIRKRTRAIREALLAHGAQGSARDHNEVMALVYLYGSHCAEHPEDAAGQQERLAGVKTALGVTGALETNTEGRDG